MTEQEERMRVLMKWNHGVECPILDISKYPAVVDTFDYDKLDMKILGFKSKERYNGDWKTLMFDIAMNRWPPEIGWENE